MFVRTPIMFDEPSDQGGGAPVITDPAPAPVADAPAPTPTPDATGDPAPVVETPPDWGARVTEWGGEDTINDALELRKALGTRDGVHALFIEAGNALGLGEAQLQQLLGGGAPAGESGEQAPSLEELLADPDRVLTAGEVMQILEQRDQQGAQERQQQEAARQINTTISSTLADLKVTDPEDTTMILALADTLLGQPTSDPNKIRQAITQAHARYNGKVQQQGQQYVQEKHEAHGNLPQPLPAGASGGGETLPEPRNLAEAKARVRKALGQSA